MTHACHCPTCPGYYLGAHPCTCACHQRRLDALLKPIDDEDGPEDPTDGERP